MFTIGAFARLAGVSVRTLRLYDQNGLLPPAAIDADTGYRSYQARQLPRLHRILALKDLGLSLDKIADLLDSDVSAEQLRVLLGDQRADIEARMAEDQARLARIEYRLRCIQLEDDMSLDMVMKQIPPVRVAQVRWTGEHGLTFSGMDQFLLDSFTKIESALEAAHLKPVGPWFLHYRDRDDGTLDPAVACPIGDEPFTPQEPIEVAVLPAIHAVTAIHRGAADHDAIGPLYGQMARFAEERGYRTAGPGRDHFVGSDAGDVVMEIQLPVTVDD